MNWLRFFKLSVMLLVPVLGALYIYQFQDQAREVIRPFEPFRSQPTELSLPAQRDSRVQLTYTTPLTIINYWATWCPPCVEEFPSMLEMQRVLADQGVKLVFISVDEKWEDVVTFMEKYRIQVPDGQLYWDPDKKAAELWGSTKFPETYVVRGDGWVVEKIIGLQQWTRPAVMEYFRELATRFKDLKT